jgi:hypothetical protein
VVTSRPGSSRTSSRPKSEQRFDRFADWRRRATRQVRAVPKPLSSKFTQKQRKFPWFSKP